MHIIIRFSEPRRVTSARPKLTRDLSSEAFFISRQTRILVFTSRSTRQSKLARVGGVLSRVYCGKQSAHRRIESGSLANERIHSGPQIVP